MTLLFLGDAFPFPTTTGGRERDLQLARVLAESLDVELVVLGAGTPHQPERFRLVSAGPKPSRLRALLTSWRLPYEVTRHDSRRLRRVVRSRRWSTVQASHAYTMRPALVAGAPVVLDAHNVETEVARSAARLERTRSRRARGAWEARKLERFERALVPRADVVLATSDDDASTLTNFGARELVVIPNGVDTGAIAHRPPGPGSEVLYVGSYDYLPNAAAAGELVTEVLPRLRATVANATLRLVGRQPPVSPTPDRPWLRVSGEVSEVLPFIRQARVTVLPLRAGGGTRLKVLEALAAGLPVVSTRFGVAGLGLVPERHVLLGETPTELAAQAARIITDDGLAATLSRSGRAEVERRFDWRTVAAPLAAVHARLAER